MSGLDFLLIAPSPAAASIPAARDQDDLTRVANACIAAASRALTDDVDDGIASPDREDTLRQIVERWSRR